MKRQKTGVEKSIKAHGCWSKALLAGGSRGKGGKRKRFSVGFGTPGENIMTDNFRLGKGKSEGKNG